MLGSIKTNENEKCIILQSEKYRTKLFLLLQVQVLQGISTTQEYFQPSLIPLELALLSVSRVVGHYLMPISLLCIHLDIRIACDHRHPTDRENCVEPKLPRI